MNVIIVKVVMTGDVSPVAMFLSRHHFDQMSKGFKAQKSLFVSKF